MYCAIVSNGFVLLKKRIAGASAGSGGRRGPPRGKTMKKLSIISKRFLKDSSGAPLVEFAIIVPVFLMLFLGGFAAFDATRAARQTSLAASTLSDLATRVLTMNDETRDAMFLTADSMLGKYAANASAVITMTSIVNVLGDDSDDLSVSWSVSNAPGGALDIDDFSAVELPTIVDGESVIYVTVAADYDPVFKVFGSGGGAFSNLSMQRSAVRRPRFVREVIYE